MNTLLRVHLSYTSTSPVGDGARPRGRFDRVEVNSDGLRAVPVYTAEGLPVRLVQR